MGETQLLDLDIEERTAVEQEVKILHYVSEVCPMQGQLHILTLQEHLGEVHLEGRVHPLFAGEAGAQSVIGISHTATVAPCRCKRPQPMCPERSQQQACRPEGRCEVAGRAGCAGCVSLLGTATPASLI